MSSSINTEVELRCIAEKLHKEACSLEEAANVLENLREQQSLRETNIKNAKKSVKRWLGE